jgi:hypothetical protein
MPTARDFLAASLGLLAGFAGAPAARAEAPAVAVYTEPAVLPGDAVHAGADQFALFLQVASLRQRHVPAGLVYVGDRYAVLRGRAEAALTQAALMGLPVVRIRRARTAPAGASGLFVEAGALPAPAARALLLECLSRFGAPAAAADPAHPTAAELAAVRARVARYQARFDAAARAGALVLQ